MGHLGLDDAPELPSPKGAPSVGKYQLLAVLGRGGMADVFLAVARGPVGFNKLAVVKRLRGSLSDDEQFREMFLDEARLAARLNHPNVVQTYEVGASDSVYFIAMEYLEGQSLNKIIKEGAKRPEPFDPLFCARIASDALAGLHHAHELCDYDGTPLRIVHRDVSPHNVFVTYDGVVKVVDFGIAKAALRSVETEVGVIKGKVAYMSPEQAGGGPIDARADIFAMGIVLWELLTKQRLMAGDSAAATLHRLIMEPIPAVTSVRPDVDRELAGILSCALDKDPDRRFQTAQQMRDALDAYIDSAHRSVRGDQIGRQISHMFQKVRDDIHKQIQRHMQSVGGRPAATGELATLTADSIGKLQHDSSLGAELPMLQVSSGSGSGVVANLAAPAPGFATIPPPPTVPPPRTVPPTFTPTVTPDVPARPAKRGLPIWPMAVAAAVLIGAVALFARSMPSDEASASAAPAEVVPVVATVPTPAARTEAPSAPSMAATSIVTAPAATPPISNPPVTRQTASSAAPQAAAAGGQTAEPAASTASPDPQHAPHAATGAKHGPTPKASPVTPAVVAPPAPPDDPGFLTFDTYPWTKVSENGRPLGTTPLVRISLPPGSHTLTLENTEQGIKQTYSVTIHAGDTTSHRLGLK